ncbi:MAG TPA: FAD:protein FMN transferase [Anaerolineae bacterium]|nr:FAD:protein FMN transferase [Anaerolineae bacterium]
MDYQQFRAMNSDIVLAAEGSQDDLTLGFKLARDFINASEARFTRFTDFSELLCLNRTAGAWFQASPELFDVVRLACEYAAETEGLFDPTMLAALESAGYDKSMDEIRAYGVSAQPRSIYPIRSAFRAIQLDEPTQSIHLPLNTRIDLGGIAKGWIAEQAALRLSEYAEACAVSAGGDMFLIGLPSDETSWAIGLEDPRLPDRDLTTLRVGPGAVATSSITKRRWQQGRRTQHHIIDPRTGLPTETDWLSVSVIAPHAALAEVYAKALLIGGSREAERLAARRPEITYLAVDQSGQLWGSARAEEVINVIGVEYV